MPLTLNVQSELAETVKDLIEKESIPLTIVDDGAADLRIVVGQEGAESTLEVLQGGGWIACATARELARKLNTEIVAAGRLLNGLEIKIKACELGCF